MHLQDIYTYPIKSLGGIRLENAIVEEKGLQYDRRWMLVDEHGLFLSQRKHPSMALLQTQITEEGIVVYPKKDPSNQVVIPYQPSTHKTRRVTIWEDEVETHLADEEISRWFSNQLDIHCSLVTMPSATKRLLKPKYQVNNESVSFADSMPYLLISQASLDDLNSRLKDPVPMKRFRPNFVIAGSLAFQEDKWNEVIIGSARFKLTKPCARCVITTIDQESGQKAKEPLKTLSTYRKVNGEVYFGQNMLLIEGDNIRVNDSVQPL